MHDTHQITKCDPVTKLTKKHKSKPKRGHCPVRSRQIGSGLGNQADPFFRLSQLAEYLTLIQDWPETR